jgi:hypothetical protein
VKNRAPIDVDDVPGCAAPSPLRILVLVRYYCAVPESEPDSFAVPPGVGVGIGVGVGLAGFLLSEFSACALLRTSVRFNVRNLWHRPRSIAPDQIFLAADYSPAQHVSIFRAKWACGPVCLPRLQVLNTATDLDC